MSQRGAETKCVIRSLPFIIRPESGPAIEYILFLFLEIPFVVKIPPIHLSDWTFTEDGREDQVERFSKFRIPRTDHFLPPLGYFLSFTHYIILLFLFVEVLLFGVLFYLILF